MRISAKAEYACVAMLQWAPTGPTPAGAHQIDPRRYGHPRPLSGVQILLELKKAGLVASVREAEGGYQSRAAEKSPVVGHQRHRQTHLDAALRP